jgi:hypothetical protein
MNQKNQKSIPEYYTVKVEAEVPTIITYRVLASSPEEAIERLQYASLSEPVKPNLAKMKKKNAKAYRQGTLEIQASKKY